MRAATILLRDPGEPPLPPAFVPEAHPFHRPQTKYRLHIDSAGDVEAVRRRGLSISLFPPERSEALGYPLWFRPRVIVARDLLSAVETSLPTIPFVEGQAARDPTLEDYIVAMLRIDLLGARRIAYENRKKLDRTRLLKRVLQENLEGRAYRVRLDNFAPGLPKVSGVKPIAPAVLQGSDTREFARGPSA